MTALDGRVLITGAAGGIGTAIARSLAPRSSSIVLSGRNAEALSGLVDELGAQVITADLEHRDQVAGLAHAASDVDLLVLNAALPASGDILDYEIGQIDRALEVNFRAQIVLARMVGEQMAARGSGHIVFISSLAGKASAAGSSLYSATKFGIRGAAFGMRADLEPHGVGVSVICPGFVRDAGMFAYGDTELPKGIGTVSPQQVADAVVRAVEKDKAEIDVAPLTLKLGSKLALVAPAAWQQINSKTGGRRFASKMAENQKHKR